MGIPSGEELLESLRDGRLPFIDGDRERMSRPIRALPQRRRGLAQLYDMRAAWARKLRPVPGWPNEYAARLRGQSGAGPDYRNQLFVLGGGFWDKLRGAFRPRRPGFADCPTQTKTGKPNPILVDPHAAVKYGEEDHVIAIFALYSLDIGTGERVRDCD